MPSQRNIAQLAVLQEKFSRAKSVVFVDHNGMSVADMQALRAGVREAGGEVTVAKNTLLNLMLNTAHRSPLTADSTKPKADRFLSGPTSILFSYQDEILPIKVLAKFASDHEKPAIKAGLLGDKSLTKEEIIELSKLPGFKELIVKLMWQMQGPTVRLVQVLQGNTRKLVYVLEAIKKSKEVN